MEWKAPPARVDPQGVSSQTPHQRAAADLEEAEPWQAWILQPLMLTGEGCQHSLIPPYHAGLAYG